MPERRDTGAHGADCPRPYSRGTQTSGDFSIPYHPHSLLGYFHLADHAHRYTAIGGAEIDAVVYLTVV